MLIRTLLLISLLSGCTDVSDTNTEVPVTDSQSADISARDAGQHDAFDATQVPSDGEMTPDAEVDARPASICGNGMLEGGETCDDGNRDTELCEYGLPSCMVCDSECRLVPGQPRYCGDGVPQSEEECDDGAENGATLCSSECQAIQCGEALDYRILMLRGWRVCIAGRLERDDPELAERVLSALDEDLVQIVDTLPDFATAFLRRVFIWIELDEPAFPGAVYHPSPEWLAENGYPRAWAAGIQLGNAANYMSWVAQQPAMVLHELSHAWHHQRLGFEYAPIRRAYEAAMTAGLYDEVEYISGGRREAYATSNHIEYFAELTEAWFWINDFFPFERDDLLRHDPTGAEMVRDAWSRP